MGRTWAQGENPPFSKNGRQKKNAAGAQRFFDKKIPHLPYKLNCSRGLYGFVVILPILGSNFQVNTGLFLNIKELFNISEKFAPHTNHQTISATGP